MSTGIVAAQFAVGSLPASKRLSTCGQTGVNPERVQQPVGRKRMKISTIGFHCDLAGPVSETHLGQRKWKNFPWHLLVGELAALAAAINHRVLQNVGFQDPRNECGASYARSCRQEIPAGPSSKIATSRFLLRPSAALPDIVYTNQQIGEGSNWGMTPFQPRRTPNFTKDDPIQLQSMHSATYDVIIIGSGIVGAACADEFARRGMKCCDR